MNPRPTRRQSALAAGVLNAVRTGRLLRAGERVGVAVSGGADSVALLRLLLELRSELGIVLAVVHVNHGIREDAAADADFVAALAREHGLELFGENADVPSHAARKRLSLEAAGRELRYQFFGTLVEDGKLDRIATAHTLDDQAETVLLRLIRGAGTRGLAGILPSRKSDGEHGGAESIIRPLLGVRRGEIQNYLRQLGQAWREDASNRDRRFLRNRVRHELLPLLERDFNPGVVRVLGEMAAVARDEEDYWREQVQQVLAGPLYRPVSDADTRKNAAPASQLSLACFRELPLALRRRLVRALAEQVGARLDFEHVEQVLALVASQAGKRARRAELPDGVVAIAEAGHLRFERDRRSVPEKRRAALAGRRRGL